MSIEVMCRDNAANKDSKAKKYQVNVRKSNYGSPEDVLLWYSKVQEVMN